MAWAAAICLCVHFSFQFPTKPPDSNQEERWPNYSINCPQYIALRLVGEFRCKIAIFQGPRLSLEQIVWGTRTPSLEENKMAWRSVHFVWRWCKKFFAFSGLNPARIRWVFSAKWATLGLSTRLPRTHHAIREFFIHLLFWRQKLFSIKSAQPRTSPFVGWLACSRSPKYLSYYRLSRAAGASYGVVSLALAHKGTLSSAVVSVTHPPPAIVYSHHIASRPLWLAAL